MTASLCVCGHPDTAHDGTGWCCDSDCDCGYLDLTDECGTSGTGGAA